MLKLYKDIHVFGHLVIFNANFLCHLFWDGENKHHICHCEKSQIDSFENNCLVHLSIKQNRNTHPRCTGRSCTRLLVYREGCLCAPLVLPASDTGESPTVKQESLRNNCSMGQHKLLQASQQHTIHDPGQLPSGLYQFLLSLDILW